MRNRQSVVVLAVHVTLFWLFKTCFVTYGNLLLSDVLILYLIGAGMARSWGMYLGHGAQRYE